MTNKQKDAGWEKEFDKRFTVWFSELVAGKGNAKRGWWDIVNNATVEEVKAFISKVATQARQQAFTEALEAAPGKEELTGDTMNPVEILRGGFNQGVDEYRANIEKRMK